MIKPQKKIIEHWDYHECAEWVAHCLGIKDLRDIKGRWNNRDYNPNVPYQDFWDEVILYNDEIRNGQYIQIGYPESNIWSDWSKPIVEKFIEEFGEDVDYWVEW